MGFYMLDNPNPYATQGVFPRRGGVKLSGTAILHTTESVLDQIGPDATAEDCAVFIRTRTDFGCYHDLVDSDSIIEMYPFEWETWQDSETNNWAVGISAACRTTDWLTMAPERREGFYRNLAWCASDFVKYMATKGITVPLKRITGEQARNRVPGFCAHGDSGISRSDPGVNFDWDKFFRYTAEELNGTAKEWDEMATKAEFIAAMKESFKSEEFKRAVWAMSGARDGGTSITMWNRVVSDHEESLKHTAMLTAQNELIAQLAAGSGIEVDYEKINAGVAAMLEKIVKVQVTVESDDLA